MENCSAASTFLTDSLELELGTEWCKPPCFSCGFDNRTGGNHFSGESYLSSGALKRQVKKKKKKSEILFFPSQIFHQLGMLFYDFNPLQPAFKPCICMWAQCVTWVQALSSVVGCLVRAYPKGFWILSRTSCYQMFSYFNATELWVESWLLISLLLKVDSEPGWPFQSGISF